MRRQSIIALGVAVFLALIAVFLVNSYLGSAEKEQEASEGGLVRVAVAQVPLAFGTQVTPEKVRFVNWPRNSVPPGAFASIEQLNPAGKSHVALRPIEVGEPILKSKLSGEGGRATLSALLPSGMRAAAIRITDVAGVAGFVLPGDRVDVILTRAASISNGEQIADVLLQDIRVIAIDQDASDKSNKPTLAKTATLEVQPHDAQKLALAQSVGQLSLALRPVSAEAGQSYAQTVRTADLRGGYGAGMRPVTVNRSLAFTPPIVRRRVGTRPGSSVPAAANSFGVEVVRGVQGSSYEVGRYVGY